MSLNTIPKTDVTYQKQSQKGYKCQIFYFELACYRIYTTSSGPLSFCHATQKGNLGRDNCQCGGALSKAHLPISFPGCTGVAVINLDFQHSGLGLGGGGGRGTARQLEVYCQVYSYWFIFGIRRQLSLARSTFGVTLA